MIWLHVTILLVVYLQRAKKDIHFGHKIGMGIFDTFSVCRTANNGNRSVRKYAE